MTAHDVLESALRDAAAALPTGPAPALDVEAAEAASLIDVAYARHDTPVGSLVLAATPRGLVRVAYTDDEAGVEATLAALSRDLSPRVLDAPRRLDAARRELDEYFAGRRDRFELALDWRLTRGFARRILRSTARIPYGSVSSYAQVATAAGSPRGSRAAGNALGANPLPIVVPCHRVLHSGGGLGGYTGGLERKLILLGIESAMPGGAPTRA
ncbi:MAG TPA: methylated-DNA--[protein]-cysteine S-methyltransferase [Solirubrobacteraceae bacterium]|jgi:methylated-DNA-[protein]-cysteine S-methyltransferase|nr:methylated-DNA--[protein]-cysteine S-methyltransferase [Solirubrobacteraceae bacterium]